jgi:hypothetical protein
LAVGCDIAVADPAQVYAHFINESSFVMSFRQYTVFQLEGAFA